MMNAAVTVRICFRAEKDGPSILTIEVLSWISKFGLAFRKEERPLNQKGTCKLLLRTFEKLEN